MLVRIIVRRVLKGGFVVLSFVLVGCPDPYAFGPEDFRMHVERNFDTSEEEALIAAAEAVYPPREDVLAAIPESFAGQIPDEDLWWYDSWGDILIPYAITAEAVDYYSNWVAQAREQAEAGDCHSVTWLWSYMTYTADIDYHEMYESEEGTLSDVYVVTMRLRWSAYCGRRCGAWFEKDRVVALSPEGEPLLVSGDGTTDFWVS